jgi:hypothetical protein
MTADEVRTAYPGLAQEGKTAATARLAHNLTIAARVWYPGQTATLAGPMLQSFNELLHTVTAKLMYLGAGEADTFPDDGFLDVLFEKAQKAGPSCERALLDAFHRSLPTPAADAARPASPLSA